jgi:hypothetical protein
MRDYKAYLPHHRDSRLADLDLDGRDWNPISVVMLVAIVGLMAVFAVEGVVHHQEIEEAKAKAALVERQRIVTLVAKDIEDSRRYEAYLDRLIAKEYRGQ